MADLPLDTAQLIIVNNLNRNVTIWKQIVECTGCPLIWYRGLLPHYQENETTVKSNFGQTLSINEYSPEPKASLFSSPQIPRPANGSQLCFYRNLHFKEHAIRKLTVYEKNSVVRCTFETVEEGHVTFWPLIVAFLVYVLIAVGFYGGRWLFRRYQKRKSEETLTVSMTSPVTAAPAPKAEEDKKRKRLISLDAFRGITILMMIFANYGAGDYHYLEHAAWDGFHFADIIFPWFIFIMGTTMAISFKSLVIRQQKPIFNVMYKICKRSIVLFAIGIMLNSNGNADFRTLRIPGVLQRFAISYFVVASLHVLSLKLHKGDFFGPFRHSLLHPLLDIIPFWPEWIAMIFFSLLYFSLTFWWRFDQHCPRGYVGPGGFSDDAQHAHCIGGAAFAIDKWFFGANHIYKGFSGKQIFDPRHTYGKANGFFGIHHDPEGMLGATTSIVLTFLGLQVGKILIAYPTPRQRITRWLIWTAILGGLTALFAAPGWVPINKNLWSFSFITLTGGSACLAISLLYYLVDVVGLWPDGQPFQYPGMNSILLYIGHSLTGDMIPWSFNCEDTSHACPLARSLVGTTLWFIISIVLAHKGFFLTV